MSIAEKYGNDADKAWQWFVTRFKLSKEQADRFERYLILLKEWNEKTNLTTIVEVPEILSCHFEDSIRVGQFVDFSSCKGICDVGSGAGLPGIPLAIMYPQAPIILLEVTTKKITFLETVIEELGLDNCEVCSLDWRTLLRKAPYDIDLFLARASLKPEDLMRVFSPVSPYKEATLIYWASRKWVPGPKEAAYLVKKERYISDNQEHFYAFFKKSGAKEA